MHSAPLGKDSDSTTLPHFLSWSPSLPPCPLSCSRSQLSSSWSPTGGGKEPRHPEERRQPHPCHFQSNRGRGAPSLPPSPALTLALTGLLSKLGPGRRGWHYVCFFQSADSLGCTFKAAVCSRDPLPLPLVSRPQPPGAETLRKCQWLIPECLS